MGELLSAWTGTINTKKGIFSTILKCVHPLFDRLLQAYSLRISYDDPFHHPVAYSPTDKETIDRGLAHAQRVLTPHILVLQMLFSRLQAARYHRSSVMFIMQQLVLRSARAAKALR